MLIIKDKTIIQKISLIFFASMSAYTTCNLLFMYTYNNIVLDIIDVLFLAISAITCLAVFIYGEYSKKERNILTALLAVAAIVFMMLGFRGAELFVFVAAILMIKNVDLRSVARVICCSMLVVFLLYCIAAFIGLLPTTADSKVSIFDGNSIDFMRIGGVHGNVVFIIIFAIWSAFLYGFKVTKPRLVVGEIVIALCYFAFRSRTGLVICSIEMTYYFLKDIPAINRFIMTIREKRIMMWLEKYFIVILVLSPVFLSLFFYKTVPFNFLNSVFTSRFECTHAYVEAYGVSLVPREVKLFTPLDNLYSYIFINYGLIVYFVVMVMIVRCASRLIRGRRYDELLLLNVFGLYGMSERIIFKPACFMPLLFFAIIIYGERHFLKKNIGRGSKEIKDEKR